MEHRHPDAAALVQSSRVQRQPVELEKLREEPSTLGEGSAITLVDVPAKHPIRRIRVGRGFFHQHFRRLGSEESIAVFRQSG